MSDFAQQMDAAIAQAMGLWHEHYPTAWPVLHALAHPELYMEMGDGGKILKPWYDNIKHDPAWWDYFRGRVRDCARVTYTEEQIVVAMEADRKSLMHELWKFYEDRWQSRLEILRERCYVANVLFPEEQARCQVPMVKW